MKTYYIWLVILAVFIPLFQGCSGQEKNPPSRIGQDDFPPYFTSVIWPSPGTILSEGRLIITGNLQCQEGYFEEMPIAVDMYPLSFVEPAVSISSASPVTQEALQQALAMNQTVQGLLDEISSAIFRRVVDGPFVGADDWRDFTKGLQSQALFGGHFDEYNYVDFETGSFRVDFDQTARLTPGDILMILVGIDQNGRICTAMNIYSIPDLDPNLLVTEDSYSIAFAGRMFGLGNAMIEVLAVSGDDRSVDIQLMFPFMNFIMESYGGGYHPDIWDVAASNLREASIDSANGITDPNQKAVYEGVVSFIADIKEFDNFMYWGTHFVDLPLGTDLYQKNQEAVQNVIYKFTEFNEQCIVTERGGGVKDVSVQIYRGEEVIANFTVLGDPNNPLVVSGFIGNHNIVPEDYTPYFPELFGLFDREDLSWPNVGI